MKRIAVTVGMLFIMVAQADAEIYSWVDENGTYNFTEDLSRVPKRHRKNMATRSEMSELPSARNPDAGDSGKGTPAAVKKEAGGAVQGVQAGGGDDKGLYGGKKPEAWKSEMAPIYQEVRRLEQELERLEGQIKSPRGVSKDVIDRLAPQFRETQQRYKEVLKNYNDLNDAANKAGLPAEYRK